MVCSGYHRGWLLFRRSVICAPTIVSTLSGQLNAVKDMAEQHIGMDRSFISDVGNGRREICIRNLEVLATAFGMTVSKLMSRL
jgi:hypothetical protein